MRPAFPVAILLGLLSSAGAYFVPVMAATGDAVMNLKWDQLVPPAPPKPPKAFFSGRPGDPGGLAGPQHGPSATQPMPEGRWMSAPARAPFWPC